MSLVSQVAQRVPQLVDSPSREALLGLVKAYNRACESIPTTGIVYENFFSDVLSLNPHNDISTSATSYRSNSQRRPSFQSLMTAIDMFDDGGARHGRLFQEVFPTMVTAASEYHTALPPGSLIVNAPSVQFSKRQCFSILSAAFFCLFPRALYGQCSMETDLPGINFLPMITADVGRGSSTTTKLRMFLDYFTAVGHRITVNDPTLDDPSEALHIIRHNLKPHGSANISVPLPSVLHARPLSRLVMHGLRQSIDHQLNMCRIDFANRTIGGGSLGYGCVQEEITFTMYPELNTARLLHTPMEDTEAIILLNPERFSSIKEGTYGRRTEYGSAFDGPRSKGEVIVAVDAIPFQTSGCERGFNQRTPDAISRELIKFVSGIRGIPQDVLQSKENRIATGNWGCGAFGGDVQLKLLIQWIACSLCDCEMHYFPFDQQHVFDFAQVADALVDSGVTCGQVVDCILRADPDAPLWTAELFAAHFLLKEGEPPLAIA